MPYILSPKITEKLDPMWKEEFVYSKNNLYTIEKGKLPPVNYDTHIINSHSLTHIETQKHTIEKGMSVDQYMGLTNYYGECRVIKLEPNYKDIGNGKFHHEITKDEIRRKLKGKKKVLITTHPYPVNENGFHDPNYILTLSESAAKFLKNQRVELYGTSWSSSDYQPGSSERPIHNILFERAVILENLDLQEVEAGNYYISAFPLNIEGASESPLTPVLFKKEDFDNPRTRPALAVVEDASGNTWQDLEQLATDYFNVGENIDKGLTEGEIGDYSTISPTVALNNCALGIEMLLKACILKDGYQYPFTHDFRDLRTFNSSNRMNQLHAKLTSTGHLTDTWDNINNWNVSDRYRKNYDPLDADDILEDMEKMFIWLKSLI